MTDAAAALNATGAQAPSRPERAPERTPERDAALKQKAKEFEAAFIAQMLKYGGLTDAISADAGFGGEAFSSMLVETYADQLVETGGFGLAEKIYEQLRAKELE